MLLTVPSVLFAADEDVRFIDGIPLGGPPLAATAMEWVISHYGGEENVEAFSAGAGKRLEYLVNLVGSARTVNWAQRVTINRAGRVPAQCLILSDGQAENRTGTVEVWYQERGAAWGGAAFALGVEASSKALSRRARNDLDPRRVQDLGTLTGFPVRITPRLASRAGPHSEVWAVDAWRAYFELGPPVQAVAGQLRSMRFLERINAAAADLRESWGCIVVSGFPHAAGAAEQGMGFVARTWRTAACDRLLLVESYLGDAEPVNSLQVVILSEGQAGLKRSVGTWSWNGADWTVGLVSDRLIPTSNVRVRQ